MARGAPEGTSADMARGERAYADRVARSAVSTRGEPVTWGRHQRQYPPTPCRQGHFARRHYRLAPVVTTRTVGAGRDREACWRSMLDAADRPAFLAVATGISGPKAAGTLEMWPAWAMH